MRQIHLQLEFITKTQLKVETCYVAGIFEISSVGRIEGEKRE